MLDYALFLYGLLTMFVLSSMTRNVKERRPHSRVLTMAGWSLMSSSATLGLLLAAYAAFMVGTGASA
jgi:hypothetical protein